MANSIVYDELNGELQELYLECKQWVSDLDFLDREFVFLEKLLMSAIAPLGHQEPVEKVPNILLEAIKTSKKQEVLKQEILAYLLMLETFIINSNQNLDSTLIQKHSNLEEELSHLKLAFTTVKTMIFNLTKEGIKEKLNLTALEMEK